MADVNHLKTKSLMKHIFYAFQLIFKLIKNLQVSCKVTFPINKMSFKRRSLHKMRKYNLCELCG